MIRKKLLPLALCLLCALSLPCEANEAYRVYDLACEQECNPVGIDCTQPCFSWRLQSDERETTQTAYQLIVATSEGKLTEGAADVWNSGKVTSAQSVLVPFGGNALASATTYYWRIRSWDNHGNVSVWSQTATFTTALLTPLTDWGKSRWIAMERDGRLIVPAIHNPLVKKELGTEKVGFYKLPQFRKVVKIKKEVRQAIAFVTGLGQFEMTVNGNKVGDNFLDPGWTKYDKEALYVTFDITKLLKQGGNVVGMTLGNGFYNIPRERYFKLLGSFGAPKMRLKIVVKYADGRTDDIVSDRTWKVMQSPITYSSIYGGEDYDATLEQQGWDTAADFDDSGWQKAIEVNQDIALRSQTGNRLTVRQTVPAMSRYQNDKGQWVYDLGQNFSGIVRIKVKGEKGQSLLLRPAELQNADKTVNQKATGKPYYFKYTIGGKGDTEEWQPRFSYYGFRYVQVEGAVPAGEKNEGNLPEIVELEGLHTSNAAKEAGTFSCSKPMFNQIHSLIDWAIRSNMASVLTDCPTREKLGWQEQNHLMEYSMHYRYDMANLYHKIMNDMEASQRADGAIPTTAPEYVRFTDGFEDTPEWGSSFIICPWYIYKWYGDSRLISQHYPSMKRYMDYLASRSDSNVIAYGLGDWFDIGPKRSGFAQLTSNGVTATAIYHYDATLMAKMAEAIGKHDDAQRYATLAKEIRKAYNNTFWNDSTKTYDRNSQTANAVSLFMGLAEKDNEKTVLENLIDDIESRDYALTAGDVGYRYVVQALEDNDRADVIFKMNSKYDVPGYGWQLAHGATALTESWQAYGFVSNNHLMLGHLMEWLYGGLGGIRQSEGSVAFSDVLIDPQTVGDVTAARTTYQSPYGRIDCEWEKTDGKYSLRVSIPANSRATVCLPTTDTTKVTEYGSPLSFPTEIRNGKCHVSIGSGNYLFEVSTK